MRIRDAFTSRMALLTALSALLVLAALVPASSYASASCGGRTALGENEPGENTIQYRFGCSEKIKGFSVITNTAVLFFSESANAFDSATGAQLDKQTFECAGDIPGVGVSCSGGKNGFANAGTRVVGDLSLAKAPCHASRQLRAWLVVADATGAVSGPFQLGGPKDCGSREGRKSRARRHRR